MSAYTYVITPNINLLCCICRTPFVHPVTTRTCLHTFCRECIVTALSVAQQCPIDRSSLSLGDLLPADPLIRDLVDELEVECPNRALGCERICQRQLLASHVQEDCLYEEVSCQDGKCDKKHPRRIARHEQHSATEAGRECGGDLAETDAEAHKRSCTAVTVSCEACGSEIASADTKAHQDACPDVVVPCAQGTHGCPWSGPRYQASAHTQTCPYEAIKGFFAVHGRRYSLLTEENAVLRHKLDALEGTVNSLKRELDASKAALGPWYRPELLRQSLRHPPPSPEAASSSRRDSSESARRPFPSIAQPAASVGTAVDLFQGAASPRPLQTDPSDIASYFPPAEDAHSIAQAAAVGSDVTSFGFTSSASSSLPATTQQPGHASRPLPLYNAYPPIPPLAQPPVSPQPTPVAPLNLSTNLEGALSGLRESIVTLSASVDSLGRRQEVAVTTEAMRTAEEIRSLRAVVHGLRMQVHAVMTDHNAQVTGRAGDASAATMGPWLPPPDVLEPPPWLAAPYVPRHLAMPPAPPAFTKL